MLGLFCKGVLIFHAEPGEIPEIVILSGYGKSIVAIG
jgi:hypothetical protein